MADASDVELLAELSKAKSRLTNELGKVIVGQSTVIDELLLSMFAGGHALLVGVPGLAKTLLVSSLASCLDLQFGRVQFTPDLLPLDITGADVLHEVERDGRTRYETEFVRGPIFSQLLLADEVNRTPPKTQAALLQAMQEGHVTVGGKTYPLPEPFQVLATQNPIEQEGTYPLPEAQLDRFLVQIRVSYPSLAEEREIARRTTSGTSVELSKVLTADQVRMLRAFVPRVPVTDAAIERAVDLVRRTRPGEEGASREVNDYVRFGAGPRGSRALVLAAKASAALAGEAAADVDDVERVVRLCLRHRLVLSYRAEAERVSADDILSRLLG